MNDHRTPTETNAAHQKLERFVGHVLKQQPLRKAPGTLEARVLAALEQRTARPWWRESFLHWPLAARVAFLLGSFGVVKLALVAVMWLLADSRSAPMVSRPVSWYEHSASFVSTLGSLGATLINAIPPHWLFVGIALTAMLYVALFVLGATAYRTLYVNK
jgi:hypothetical protein